MDSPTASRRFLLWLALSFALVCAAAAGLNYFAKIGVRPQWHYLNNYSFLINEIVMG